MKRVRHACTTSRTACASSSECGRISGSWLCALTPSGTTPSVARLREAVEHTEQRVVEHRAVVDSRAHDDLAVHRHTGVEQQLEPAQARRAPAVAQQADPHVGIGRVDAHVERTQLLGDDALEVGLGEAGERREVPVEKREPEVVVLEVEAAAHPLRELVDEAERAVVVAGLHPVEYRVRELEPERRAFGLAYHDLLLEPAAPHLEVDLGAVGVQLVGDHVPELLSVDRENLVAGGDAGPLRRGSGRDGKNASSGHPPRLWGSHSSCGCDLRPSNARATSLACPGLRICAWQLMRLRPPALRICAWRVPFGAGSHK